MVFAVGSVDFGLNFLIAGANTVIFAVGMVGAFLQRLVLSLGTGCVISRRAGGEFLFFQGQVFVAFTRCVVVSTVGLIDQLIIFLIRARLMLGTVGRVELLFLLHVFVAGTGARAVGRVLLLIFGNAFLVRAGGVRTRGELLLAFRQILVTLTRFFTRAIGMIDLDLSIFIAFADRVYGIGCRFRFYRFGVGSTFILESGGVE